MCTFECIDMLAECFKLAGDESAVALHAKRNVMQGTNMFVALNWIMNMIIWIYLVAQTVGRSALELHMRYWNGAMREWFFWTQVRQTDSECERKREREKWGEIVRILIKLTGKSQNHSILVPNYLYQTKCIGSSRNSKPMGNYMNRIFLPSSHWKKKSFICLNGNRASFCYINILWFFLCVLLFRIHLLFVENISFSRLQKNVKTIIWFHFLE